jgi:hypothetical protein
LRLRDPARQTGFNGQLVNELPHEYGKRAAVDIFFRSLADTHGGRSIAIVLSGVDGDVAIGIKRIKEQGGGRNHGGTGTEGGAIQRDAARGRKPTPSPYCCLPSPQAARIMHYSGGRDLQGQARFAVNISPAACRKVVRQVLHPHR